ncbi:MAG: LuxR family transcriptional regulator [Acidimicrobiales bacterium]
MATDLDAVAKDVWDVVGGLEIPLFLVRLSEDFILTDATPAFFKLLAVPASSVLHKPIYELLSPTEQATARLALGALGDGLIDYYASHRQLHLPGGRVVAAKFWNRAIQFSDCHYSLGQVAVSSEPRDSPLVEYLGYSPPKVAVGTTNAAGTITAVSNNVIDVVGETAQSLIGRQLLSNDAQKRLLNQIGEQKEEGPLTVSMPVRFNEFSPRQSVRCVVTCLAESTSRCFLLQSESDPATASKFDRVAQLERRLWRIASEVQASGIFDSLGAFPDPERFPQLNSLSTRQWEVLSRLLRGERVPEIATALFVSPSTVRNNLSDIFKIFGVHSQSELLSLLSH